MSRIGRDTTEKIILRDRREFPDSVVDFRKGVIATGAWENGEHGYQAGAAYMFVPALDVVCPRGTFHAQTATGWTCEACPAGYASNAV